jgi:hypothetical protein
MFVYHGTTINTERIAAARCRCQSTSIGLVWDISELRGDNGCILAPDTKLPLTSPALNSLDERRLIYAVNEQFIMRVAWDGDRAAPGSVKHETIFHNADVLAAGEMCVYEGTVVALNDVSGSYSTRGALESDPRFVRVLLQFFDTSGVSVSSVLLQTLKGQSHG